MPDASSDRGRLAPDLSLGVCVVAVFGQEVAETKAITATDMARKRGILAALHDQAGRVGNDRHL